MLIQKLIRYEYKYFLFSYNEQIIMQACLQVVHALSLGEANAKSLLLLCNFDDGNSKLYTPIYNELACLRDEPVLCLLTLKNSPLSLEELSLEELFTKAEIDSTPETTAHLLEAIMLAEVQPAFHKINVHAALQPSDIETLLDPVFSQAKSFQRKYYEKKERIESSSVHSNRTSIRYSVSSTPEVVPFVTVSVC